MQLFKIAARSNSLVAILLLTLCLLTYKTMNKPTEQNFVADIVEQPRIGDIHFLDFRKLSPDLRPHEKYRIAKVADITGNMVSLEYGNFYYARENAAINAIRYGQLRYKDYFAPNHVVLSKEELKTQLLDGAIYDAKRPTNGKLFGNEIAYEGLEARSAAFIPGRIDNATGEALLKDFLNNKTYSENQLASAYSEFEKAANLGFVDAQINLAEMFINGHHVSVDFHQALKWLEKASLQSNKRAILKYQIVCQQVADCNIRNFYQYLSDSGVNIKVRNIPFSLEP